MAATEREAAARQAFRAAREAVGQPLKFFEKVVIDDMPLVQASSYAQFGQKRAMRRFAEMVDRLITHLEGAGVELEKIDPNRAG